MQNSVSLPYLALSVSLVVLAGWLGLVSGNPLGALYSLIAATLVAARSLESAPHPAHVTVRAEP